jgi:hypothetical protein
MRRQYSTRCGISGFEFADQLLTSSASRAVAAEQRQVAPRRRIARENFVRASPVKTTLMPASRTALDKVFRRSFH